MWIIFSFLLRLDVLIVIFVDCFCISLIRWVCVFCVLVDCVSVMIFGVIMICMLFWLRFKF